MEFVDGQTLEDLIHSVGHLSAKQTMALGKQICAGLEAIHDRGIVHRDLKPGNVMIDRAGHALMDFGMAYARPREAHRRGRGPRHPRLPVSRSTRAATRPTCAPTSTPSA